jgi:hypothetical protein
MGDKVRTEEQLLADWRAFQRLLAMTAPDHPSRPYLSEVVQHTERRYWRQVHLRRLTDSGDVPAASSQADDPLWTTAGW